MDFYETPNNRSEFEHRFHFLAHTMNQDRLHVNQSVSIEGLRKVRYLPNGRIDFLSVDESARNMANTILHMQRMNFPESIGENENSYKD